MSNGKNPLVLMMALSMPGAANAIGLGDIHVDSGLNERLAAEIDIVGATALDLSDLRAAVANRDTFVRYGVDRPAFLSSATFKVTQDGQGRPVLAVRSTESFTEPVVNFLVDLRWTHGELVRQYTLLLDPPGFGAANRLDAGGHSRVGETRRRRAAAFYPGSARDSRRARRGDTHRRDQGPDDGTADRPAGRSIPIRRKRPLPAKPRISRSAPKPRCAASRGARASDPNPICRK